MPEIHNVEMSVPESSFSEGEIITENSNIINFWVSIQFHSSWTNPGKGFSWFSSMSTSEYWSSEL